MYFQTLLRFKEENGNLVVGPRHNKEWPGLHGWIHGQRRENKRREAGEPKATMEEEWVTKLNDLGFDFAPMSGDKAGFSKMLAERSTKSFDDAWHRQYA